MSDVMDIEPLPDDGGREGSSNVECFRGLIEESTVGFYRTRPDGSMVFANPALLQMLGGGEFEALSCRDLRKEGREAEFTRRDLRQWLDREGRVNGLGCEWKRHDGTTIYVVESARVVRNKNGEPVFYDGLVEDTTGLRRAQADLFESQEMLQAVLDNIPQGVFWKDREGRYLGGNKALVTQMGLESVEAAIGKTDYEMPWSGSAPSFAESDRWVLETETSKLNYEEPMVLRNGTTRWVRKSKVPFRDLAGRIIGVLGTAEDITTRKQMEDNAKLREALLQGYFRSSPLGMFLIDRDLRFLRVNEALAASNGTSPKQHLGKSLSQLLPNLAPQVEPYLNQVFSTGEAIDSVEVSAVSGGQEKKPSHYVVSFFPLGEGECGPLAVGGVVRDITRRKQKEERLLLTQFSIDHAVDGVFWAKPDGHFAYVNDAACRMLGYTREELESLAVYDIDCEITETVWPQHRERMKEHSPVTFESRVLTKGGQIIPVEIDISYIHYRGWDIFIAFLHDKTESKHVQEKLLLTQFAVDHCADPIYRADAEGRISYVNDAACRFLGYTRAELESMSIPDINCDVSRGKWPAHWLRLKENGAITFESRDRTKDGRIIPVEITMNFLAYAGKEHGIGFVRDMTEHKRVERELQDSSESLRALAARLQNIREEERKKVARNIHDQLGQALTAIKMDVAAFDHECPRGGHANAARVNSILTQVDEMIGAVRRISTELRPGILDDLGLSAAIEWAAEQFRQRTGIACSVDAPEAATPSNPQSTIVIFRIFQETLTNIVRHAAATRVNVHLTEKNDGLVLEVRDNGRGIAPQQASGGKSLGILGMRERALSVGGQLTIRPLAEGGTMVAVWVPDTWQEDGRPHA